MLFWLANSIVHTVTLLLFRVLQSSVYVSLFVCLAYKVGWVERFIWFLAEREATKVLNGTLVTFGSLKINWNWMRGIVHVKITNVIIHTPQRELWQWESPLVARIGHATIEANLIITIAHIVLFKEEIPVEIYTAKVEDVQVFVERKQNIFNFYLFDKQMILPDPRDLAAEAAPTTTISSQSVATSETGTVTTVSSAQTMASTSQQENINDDSNNASASRAEPELAQQLQSQESNGNVAEDQPNTTEDGLGADPSSSSNDEPDDKERDQQLQVDANEEASKKKAEKLVVDMLTAVKTLGKAAKKKNGFKDALHKQGHNLASRLRTIPKGKETLAESVMVMQQVGKVAAESIKKTRLKNLVPQRIRGGKPPPVARVGRIVVKQLRVFTRDSWIRPEQQPSSSKDNTKRIPSSSILSNGSEKSTPKTNNYSTSYTTIQTAVGTSEKNGWNKPITLQEVVFRAAELCPPMSSTDEDDLPAIYQPVDKLAEVVWRRILAEMAKTNTGRLFQTAIGEALAFIKTSAKT